MKNDMIRYEDRLFQKEIMGTLCLCVFCSVMQRFARLKVALNELNVNI